MRNRSWIRRPRLCHGSDAGAGSLGLGGLFEVLARDETDVRVLILGGEGLEDLADAGVGFDGLEEADGLSADAGVAVVEQGFEDGVADAHIDTDVGFQAFEGLAADCSVAIVAKGNHEGVADGTAVAVVPGAAGLSEQVNGAVVDGGVAAIAGSENEKLADLRVVHSAEGGFGKNAVEADFDVVGSGLKVDIADAGDLGGVEVGGNGQGSRCLGRGGRLGGGYGDGGTGAVVVATPGAGSQAGEEQSRGEDGSALEVTESAEKGLADAAEDAPRGMASRASSRRTRARATRLGEGSTGGAADMAL